MSGFGTHHATRSPLLWGGLIPPSPRSVHPGQRKTRCSVAEGRVSKDLSLKHVTLGNSDLLVSEACLGTMTYGQQNDEQEAHTIMSRAVDLGINFFDTAEMYPVAPKRETAGRTSTYIGSWLKTSSSKREDVIIASKIAGRTEVTTMKLQWLPANRSDPRGEEVMPRVDAKSIRSAVEGELRRLQTDYIDLFQIHWPDRYRPFFGKVRYRPENEWSPVPFEEQVQAMGNLIAEGKVRHWGLSNESTYGVTMMCITADKLNLPRPISVQNGYSLMDRNLENDLAETIAPSNFNLSLLPYSAAGGGALSGKYLNGARPKGARMSLFPDRYFRFLSDRSARATVEYGKIAREFGLTPVQLSYLFCKSRWFVESVIIGATTVEQLEENVNGFSLELPQEALDAIDGVHLKYSNPQNLD
ncbi:hypothetical protein BSKO_13170 [Bryopsis sp. KO-2023]|nr:hypothetical protein BSKO_13170 [Bryopsis sp. KO-2023]